jgi:hypothetical protein
VGERFSAPVRTGSEAHPASCTMGTGSFPGGEVRPGRDAVPSPPPSAEVKKQSTAIPLLSLRAFVDYERVKPTYKRKSSHKIGRHVYMLAEFS